MDLIKPEIFKNYDIRGIYPTELNENSFYLLGRLFAQFLKEKLVSQRQDGKEIKIVVGRDARASSSALSRAFIKGVLEADFIEERISILNLKIVTTPMFYYAVNVFKAEGGAMITASHNPSDYNGLKLVEKNAVSVSAKEIQERFEKYSFSFKSASEGIRFDKKRRRIKEVSVFPRYLKKLLNNFKIKRRLKIVVDAAGGSTVLFLPQFLEKLAIEYVPLFFKIDEFFVFHNPNPLALESQKFAREEILRSRADFGVIFDGDGDRIIFLDEKANVLRGDVIGGIIAENFLKEGEMVISNLVSSHSLEDCLTQKGIKVKRTKVGHFYIQKEMMKSKSAFGLEISGHYYFKSLNYINSSFLALVRVLEAMDKNPSLKLSDLATPFLRYFYSGEINFKLASADVGEKILSFLKREYQDGKQSFLDGILVEYKDWWFNFRLSNTEPVVRLVVESKRKDLLDFKRRELIKKIKRFAVKPQ